MIYIENPLSRDVGINLGRGQVPVPQQFLKTSQVGTTVQQMGRKAMP